ncbi:helix-turn-helix domain-containing protein [Bremerella cremea]|uniref:HTH araC/xylS-type domain-containing protein n=2 Tax=Pirellulales TaxID=2691354 RepID=A0A2S8FYW7_9BACT|nr:hypothetical protein C5Y83_05390 [Blastopirellula marina]RCS49765.1 helix-turn-helix domain-containing protein [Bremerella cremea]
MRLPLLRRVLHFFDPDLLSDSVANAGFEQRLLSRGRFNGEMHRVHLPDCNVDCGRYSLPCLGRSAVPDGWVMIAVTRYNSQPAWANGYHTESNHVQLFAEGASLDYRAVANAWWYVIQLRREWLQLQSLQILKKEVDFPCHGAANLIASEFNVMQLVRQLNAIFFSPWPQITNQPLYAQTLLIDAVLTVLSDATPVETKLRQAAERQAKFMRSIESYLSLHLAEPFYVQNMVKSTKIDERTLQRHCRQIYGLTPVQLFGVARLNQIRRELQSADRENACIRSLIERFGVVHQGRFSVEYRKHFGEHPTETLKRY